MRPVDLPFYARVALTLLAIVLTFFILKVAGHIFVPLVFALLISILLYPLNKFFEKTCHMGRGLSALLPVFLFILCLAGFIYFMAFQFISFSSDFPQLKLRFQEMFDNLQHWLSFKLKINTRQQTDYINRSVNGMAASAGRTLSTLFVSITGALLLMIFIFLFAFFMLFHRKLLMRFVLHLFSVPNRSNVYEVIMATKSLINAYVLGLLIEMVVVGAVNCTMLMIMGVKYALLLGVMAAVLNIIPYLGIYTSIAFIFLVTLANSTANHALGAAIGLFIVHILDSNILMPRIVGARVKMNPFITIIAVVIGEFAWGIPGMFLFIPLVGIMKLVCERIEGLEAWSILIGVDDSDKGPEQKVNIDRNRHAPDNT